MKCLVVDDDELSRNIIEDLIAETDLTLVKSCSSAMEAFNILKSEKIDLLFLDVDMPKMSGIDLLKSLTELPQVILITAHARYAVESYEYNVTDFVVKPISHPRFLKAVEKAKKNLQQPSVEIAGSATIFVKADSRLVQLPVDQILYIEALGNYVNIYTPGGRYTVLTTMKEVEARLTPPAFARVHRSFIVKVDKIESIEDNLINIGGKTIPIGKNYKEELMKGIKML